ncbi:MAG TPA: hypothetical protein PLX41_06955 [Bacteroidales bacterium]|nr:hypothetical protein [Bacteroidales bacterium]
MEYTERHSLKREKKIHPHLSIGFFFIVLGLALLVATNDMLHLGDVKEYFTWQTAMVFVGVLMLLNLNFLPGLLLIAGGVWFLLDDYYNEVPEILETMYWPAVTIILGILFIISSLFRKKQK